MRELTTETSCCSVCARRTDATKTTCALWEGSCHTQTHSGRWHGHTWGTPPHSVAECTASPYMVHPPQGWSSRGL